MSKPYWYEAHVTAAQWISYGDCEQCLVEQEGFSEDHLYSNWRIALGFIGSFTHTWHCTPPPCTIVHAHLRVGCRTCSDVGLLRCVAVIVALSAQFFPIPFPESRPFLAVCVFM